MQGKYYRKIFKRKIKINPENILPSEKKGLPLQPLFKKAVVSADMAQLVEQRIRNA